MKKKTKPIIYNEALKVVLSEYKRAQRTLTKMNLLFSGYGIHPTDVGIALTCPHSRVILHHGEKIKICRKDVEPPNRKSIGCPDCRIDRCPLLTNAHNW
jgi:hypothetical protein